MIILDNKFYPMYESVDNTLESNKDLLDSEIEIKTMKPHSLKKRHTIDAKLKNQNLQNVNSKNFDKLNMTCKSEYSIF